MTTAPTSAPPSAVPATPHPLSGDAPQSAPATPNTYDLLADVEIEVTVEFGRRRMALADIAHLSPGSVVELDTLAGEPLVVFANGQRIATGEAVVVDGQFGVRIQQLAR